MRLARFPSASALPTRKKRLHPGAGCGLPGCRPPSSAIRSDSVCAARKRASGTLSGIRRAECLSKPCALHGFQARRLCETQKRPHPGAGCGLPGCSPLLPLQSTAAALPARFPGFGAPNVSQNHALCMASKRVGFANTQKRLHPGAGCGLPGCSPLLPLQSAATACALRESGPPARFPGFGAPNVSQNHAPCTVSKRVGFAKRKKGRTLARDAASGLSFRRWRCFGCGSCGRRCRRGRPAPRACRTRRCARPG